MRLRNFIKLISGLTVGVMATVALLVFICPGIFMPDAAMAASDAAMPCQSDAGMSVGAGGFGDCLGAHLVATERFVGSLGGETGLVLSAFFIFTIIYFASLAKFLNGIRAALVRYRYRYRLYFSSIRLRCRKKMMAWLLLAGNHNIASLI